MEITIENQKQKIKLKTKIVDVKFDVKNGEYISCVCTKNFYKTQVFSYDDFSVFVCILFKNNCKKLRFILFNLKKQQAIVLFEVKYLKNLLFKRLNKTNFLLVEQLKDECVMHLCFFDENKKINCDVQVGKIKRICVFKKQKIVVHSIQNNLEKIVIYNFDGAMHSTIFCDSVFNINKVQFCFLKNYILVKDFNQKILVKQDLNRIINDKLF